jgi:hypothetical protein
MIASAHQQAYRAYYADAPSCLGLVVEPYAGMLYDAATLFKGEGPCRR